MTELTTLEDHEAARVPDRRPRPPRRTAGRPGLRWAVLWAAVVAWSWWGTTGDGPLLNTGGLPSWAEFWRSAVTPELSPDFLAGTGRAALTTVAFAVLGAALSVVVGLLLALPLSQTWWGSSGKLLGARVVLGLPRGVHEAVWALLLVSVLGSDPLVGVLAIAVPFGAITAKVYAELLDEADHAPYDALRQAGAGRLAAVAYGLLPTALPGLTSYAFYRFECAIRSAVVLGMVGVGGLGLQLTLSFQGSVYSEMWTSIYALVLLSAAVDRWGAALRSGSGRRRWVWSGVALGVLVVGSVVHLGPDVGRWFSGRTATLLDELVDSMVPWRLPDGGWPELVDRSVETLQMSVLAVTIASVAGLLVAVVAARGGASPVRRLLAWVARMVLLLTRAVPPPVWALLVLFVVFPGPLPGALALGIYTFGILGRLFAEVVEELDQRPRQALTLLGAPPSVSFAYATVPAATGRMVAYALYRWEVTARETVVVGVVGAGGLGRQLEEQRAAFDHAGMAATVAALVVVSLLVDLTSMAVRRSLR